MSAFLLLNLMLTRSSKLTFVVYRIPLMTWEKKETMYFLLCTFISFWCLILISFSMFDTASDCLIYILFWCLQIGRSFVVSKLKDYPKFRSVAIAIQKSGFKVCVLLNWSSKLQWFCFNIYLQVPCFSFSFLSI